MSFPEAGLIPEPYHHMMLVNGPRMAAFTQAIQAVVQPGDTVVEAGCGTGVLSALAARAGAGRVHALELSPGLARVARRTMALNGLADTVTVVEGDAASFTPEGPVDVVICEMLHVGLVNERQVPVLRALHANLKAAPRAHIPFAAVNALQLMEVDYAYAGLDIPIVRSCNPYIEDPRLAPVSEPVIYWVCRMEAPEAHVNTVVALTAVRDARVNAAQIVTKAVLTPDFARPDNDWYLFQLQWPLPPRDVKAGETHALRIVYDAGCPLDQLTLNWA